MHAPDKFIILNGMVKGAVLLQRYLSRHGVSGKQLAEMVGASRGAVHYWLKGVQRPRPEAREAIEMWSKGDVPADSWKTADEQADLDHVKPFTGTG